MKTLLVISVLALSLHANAADPPAWPKEPKDFRGVPFGASEKDVVSALKLDQAVACLEIEEQRSCIHHGTIGEVKAMELYQFEDDRLVQVHISFKAPQYESLRDLFIARYGPPAESWTEPFETVGGASATNEILEWRGETMILQMEKFGPSLHESLAVIATREWYDQQAEN